MQFDMAVSVKAKDDGLFYSKDVMAFKNYAIPFKENNLKISSVEGLAKYSVVAWYGASELMSERYKNLFSKKAIAKRKGSHEGYPNQNIQNVFF